MRMRHLAGYIIYRIVQMLDFLFLGRYPCRLAAAAGRAIAFMLRAGALAYRLYP
jgi:hypothetical protein